MVDIFAAAESVSTHHPPLLEQAVLCDFITEGHFARHIRRMRELYAERLSVLLECAQEKLAGALEISSVEAGLQTVGWLKRGLRARTGCVPCRRSAMWKVVPIEPVCLGDNRGAKD